MKNNIFFRAPVLALICCCLVTACTKYADPDLVAMEVAGHVCNAMWHQCHEDGEFYSESKKIYTTAYAEESACTDKLTTELQTYQKMNNIKIKQDDFDLCKTAVWSCEDFKKTTLPVPTGCESLSGWFNK